MVNGLIALTLPLLLVFGLYHLLTWFNVFRINSKVFWKRVALTAAIAHFLLATGFLVFTYFDYRANQTLAALGLNYATFLFNRSSFSQLVAIFDTVPMLALLALFTFMDRASISGAVLLPLTIGIVYVFGTLQWYYLGGAIGAVLERFWEGLKTGEDEEWF